MPLLATEAAKLSNIMLERGVIEEIIDKEELFALFPFKHVNGKAYVYNREGTLSEGTFLNPYDAVTEGAATFNQITTYLKIMAGDVDLDKFLVSTQSDSNDQLAIQLAAKSKAMARLFKRTLAQGDSVATPTSFDGVRALTPAGQTLVAGTNGAAVNLDMIDQLRDTVKNGADVFMMRPGTWRAIRSILRAINGNDATMITVKDFGAMRAIDGIPVIVNEFLDATEVQGSNPNTCSIYGLTLNEVNGLHGIVGGEAAGLTVENIGTVQNKDCVRYRVKWYVSTALKSTQSIARLKGITNI